MASLALLYVHWRMYSLCILFIINLSGLSCQPPNQLSTAVWGLLLCEQANQSEQLLGTVEFAAGVKLPAQHDFRGRQTNNYLASPGGAEGRALIELFAETSGSIAARLGCPSRPRPVASAPIGGGVEARVLLAHE